jgi:delta 1-pyrroline-5-carboxylate dehydrogenase
MMPSVYSNYFSRDFLLNEGFVCINTTAAGGSASLMSIG